MYLFKFCLIFLLVGFVQFGTLLSLEYEVRSDDLDNKIRFINSDGLTYVEEGTSQYFIKQLVYENFDLNKLSFTFPSVIYPAVIVQTYPGRENMVARLYRNDNTEEHFLQVFDVTKGYGSKKELSLGKGSFKIGDVSDSGDVFLEGPSGEFLVYDYESGAKPEKVDIFGKRNFIWFDDNGELVSMVELLSVGASDDELAEIKEDLKKQKGAFFPFRDGTFIAVQVRDAAKSTGWFSYTTLKEIHISHVDENGLIDDLNLTEELDFSPGEDKDYDLKALLFLNKEGGMALEVEDNDGKVHRIFVSPVE